MSATCNENWHVFKNILKAGEICQCGKRRTTATPGVDEPVNDMESSDSGATDE